MAKWTLTIEEEGGKTHPIQLVRDVYTIGRAPSNDISLHDRNVSRRHARLERAGNDRWVLVDENSRFGCFINGERVKGRSYISPVDSAQIGGYHLTVLSSWGKRGGVAPALSVTRSLLVPVEVPPKLRIFDGLSPVADVRLDRGPVTLGTDQDCTVRLLGIDGALVNVRPLPGGSFEIVDRGDVVLVRLKGQELRRKILENADLFDLGDNLAIRFLQGGRHARADDPDFSPSPLVDLSNGVAEAKVLGVEGVPILRQSPANMPAASTLMGLQAPKVAQPPPLPSVGTANTPADPVPWHAARRDARPAPGPHHEIIRPQIAPQMTTQRLKMPRLATQRLPIERPLPPPLPPDEAWASASASPSPPAIDEAWAAAGAPPDEAWAAPTPMSPQAELGGWPMGPRAPSSPPGPGPDMWMFANPQQPPPGFGMPQPVHRMPYAPSRSPSRRVPLAIAMLVPLVFGALTTVLFVIRLRPSTTQVTTEQPSVSSESAEAAMPAASDPPPADSAAPATSASAAPASSADDAPAQADRHRPGGKWRKPGAPGGISSAEAERQRQVRCQQRGGQQCNLRPPLAPGLAPCGRRPSLRTRRYTRAGAARGGPDVAPDDASPAGALLSISMRQRPCPIGFTLISMSWVRPGARDKTALGTAPARRDGPKRPTESQTELLRSRRNAALSWLTRPFNDRENAGCVALPPHARRMRGACQAGAFLVQKQGGNDPLDPIDLRR